MIVAGPDRTATSACGDRRVVIGSVARIAGFEDRDLSVEARPREEWRSGDYVLAELPPSSAPMRVEVPSGRIVELLGGDLLLGAFGRRAATLDLVGDWARIGDDGRVNALNAAGVIGRCTSVAAGRSRPADLDYVGHAIADGSPLAMTDCVGDPPAIELSAPVVMIIGTSMSAGKTIAGQAIVRSLRRMGMRVGATKLTGVGRYRDILSMGDAGAEPIADFVDAGLPSTVVDRDRFRSSMEGLLAMLAAGEPDVVVAEAGASPMEPYNGDTAVEILGDRIGFTVLCASDPYAVVGVIDAFGTRPDLISGLATSTEAGRDLIDRLVGLPALNLLDPESTGQLSSMLAERLPGVARA